MIGKYFYKQAMSGKYTLSESYNMLFMERLCFLWGVSYDL